MYGVGGGDQNYAQVFSALPLGFCSTLRNAVSNFGAIYLGVAIGRFFDHRISFSSQSDCRNALFVRR
jgi:hypothetical protein